MNEIRTAMTTNETWNDCPQCGEEWKDAKPIPGLLHRTILCDLCKSVNKSIKEKVH